MSPKHLEKYSDGEVEYAIVDKCIFDDTDCVDETAEEAKQCFDFVGLEEVLMDVDGVFYIRQSNDGIRMCEGEEDYPSYADVEEAAIQSTVGWTGVERHSDQESMVETYLELEAVH